MKNEHINNKEGVEILREKMTDILTPGFVVECDPDEAELLGAFYEDALTEDDALGSHIDENDLNTD